MGRSLLKVCSAVHDMEVVSRTRTSQVTHVTFASDTFNRTHSPHRTCVALVLSMTHNGLEQHALQTIVERAVMLCRVIHEVCHGTRADLQLDSDAFQNENMCIHAACTA